jgi:hypothetical protein
MSAPGHSLLTVDSSRASDHLVLDVKGILGPVFTQMHSGRAVACSANAAEEASVDAAVTIIRAYRYALDATTAQERRLWSHAGAARFAWNWGLAK